MKSAMVVLAVLAGGVSAAEEKFTCPKGVYVNSGKKKGVVLKAEHKDKKNDEAIDLANILDHDGATGALCKKNDEITIDGGNAAGAYTLHKTFGKKEAFKCGTDEKLTLETDKFPVGDFALKCTLEDLGLSDGAFKTKADTAVAVKKAAEVTIVAGKKFSLSGGELPAEVTDCAMTAEAPADGKDGKSCTTCELACYIGIPVVVILGAAIALFMCSGDASHDSEEDEDDEDDE